MSAISKGSCKRAGLLATQGIRGGDNRTVLDRIKRDGDIFWAESDHEWVLDGATVHVSMVAFDDGRENEKKLDGRPVEVIYSNLTGGSKSTADMTRAWKLAGRSRLCFLGVMKAGAFDLREETALVMLRAPNPHNRPNSDVLRPRLTSRDILQRTACGWIIDFGCYTSRETSSRYETPWSHVAENVRPKRLLNRRKRLAEKWWIHGEPRPGLRQALEGLPRFLVTPEVSKHRVFVWLDAVFLADHQTRAFASADNYFFGVLHSCLHEIWARAQGTQLRERESGFRYTPTTCFETFPFPEPSEVQRVTIAAAAEELDSLRGTWLNPPEWTKEHVLEFPGSVDGPWKRYVHDPDDRGIGTVLCPRLDAKDDDCADKLKKRTLTNLYNERPTWLDLAHQKLDEAVSAAYNWSPEISDKEILENLLALNLERSAQE